MLQALPSAPVLDDEEILYFIEKNKLILIHGAGDPALAGREPEGAGLEEQGLGWKNAFGSGKSVDTTTSGIEGVWIPNPTEWGVAKSYFDVLFGYERQL